MTRRGASLAIATSSLFRTGVLLVAIPVVFQIGALLVLLRSDGKAAAADRWELHSKEVLSQSSDAAIALAQAHSAGRALILFEDRAFEADRRVAITKWLENIDALRAAVADNSSQQRQLDRVREAGSRYIDWFEGVEALAAAGRWDDVRREYLSMTGKTRLDETERQLARFDDEEHRLDRLRVDAAARARADQRTMLLVLAAVSIALALGLVVVFSRTVSSRLQRLAVNAQRLATGAPLDPPLQGTDEIAGVDHVLHDSAWRLREAADAERRAVAALEAQRDTLARTNAELAFKTQENELFVYSVSHDLRSPLVNLQGFTRELVHGCEDLRATIGRMPLPAADRDRVAATIDGEMQTAIGFIQTAVRRLSSIVDALLRLSRAGKVQYESRRIELDAVVAEIARAMRVTLTDRHVQLTIRPLPAVTGDPTAIEQVFANLIGNAAAYLDPSRSGLIEVGERTGAENTSGLATVYVRDNGLGIAAAHMNKLFVPFERLHGDRAKGEGVGLALVKRVVDRHGGRVWAESTQGAGTTFFVSLRRADVTVTPGGGPFAADTRTNSGAVFQ